MSHQCVCCEVTCVRKNDLQRHLKLKHPEVLQNHICEVCSKFFITCDEVINHLNICRQKSATKIIKKTTQQYLDNISEIKMRNKIDIYNKDKNWVSEVFEDITIDETNFVQHNIFLFEEYLLDNIDNILNELMEVLLNTNNFLLIGIFTCVCIKQDFLKDTSKEIDFIVASNSYLITNKFTFKENLLDLIKECSNILQEKGNKESNLIFIRISDIKFSITKFTTNERSPIENETNEDNIFFNASGFIPKPTFLLHKKSLVNIENYDDKCLMWNCIAHFYTADKSHCKRMNNVETYKPYEKLFMFPSSVNLSMLSLRELKKIEQMNDLSITVLQLKDNIENMTYTTFKRTYKRYYNQTSSLNEDSDSETINSENDDENKQESALLQSVEGDDLYLPYYNSTYKPINDGRGFNIPHIDCSNRKIYLLLVRLYSQSHFYLIKDIELFFHRKLVCTNCLVFKCCNISPNKYLKHIELCHKNKPQHIKMLPEGKNIIKYKEFKVSHPISSFIALDFETTNEDFDDQTEKNTTILKKMKANSFGLYFKTWDVKLDIYSTFSSEDENKIVTVLLSEIKHYANKLFIHLVEISQSVFDWKTLSVENQTKHDSATKCELCYTQFITDKDNEDYSKYKKVLHHSHWDGSYISTVCQKCNAKLKDKKLLPVFIHNLRGFDSHIFIKQLAEDPDVVLSIIPLTSEKFISFEYQIRLPDGTMRYKKRKMIKKDKNNNDMYENNLPVYDYTENHLGKRKYLYENIPLTYDNNGQPLTYELEKNTQLMTVRFLDSLSFMNSSLDNLIENNKLQSANEYKSLSQMSESFRFTFSHLMKQGFRLDQIILLLQKGVYPYSYIKSYDDLFSDGIPAMSNFVSDLTCRSKSNSDNINEICHLYKWLIFYRIRIELELDESLSIKYQYLEMESNHYLFLSFKWSQCDTFKSLCKSYGDDIPINEMETKFIVDLSLHLNTLSEEEIVTSLETYYYNHAVNVYSSFGMNSFICYHNLYLTMDVLLLTDVLYNFQSICLKSYGIEPMYKYGLPGVSWSALIKKLFVENNTIESKQNRKFEIINDENIRLLLEKGRRGGICGVSLRKKDIKSENEGMIYVDQNSLYAWAMSEKLPLSNYKIYYKEDRLVMDFNLHLHDRKKCHILNYVNNDDGYFLEVDIYLPDKLHDKFSDYPLLPESMCVKVDQMSSWQRDFKAGHNVEKLLSTLYPKKNYVVHIRMLKLAMELGYVCTKVHSIISFYQEAFIESYITQNIDFRAKAKTVFEKDFYKLMNNIIYGKMCQKKDQHFEYKMTNNEHKARKLINSNRYEGKRDIFSDSLVGIKLKYIEYTFDSPLPVACAILDLSKMLMFDTYYNHIKVLFDKDDSLVLNKQSCRMCYTDTDSLIIYMNILQNTNLYRDYLLKESDIFDLSAYSEKHEIFLGLSSEDINSLRNKNAKKRGKLKDESGDNKIASFRGIRAKCYSILMNDNEEHAKCKGITDTINFDEYDSVFQNNNIIIHREQVKIRSRKHELGIEMVDKKAFSIYDDKRYLFDGNSESLPYGHYSIR